MRTQHLRRPQHVDSAQRSGSREVGGHTLGVVCGRRRGRRRHRPRSRRRRGRSTFAPRRRAPRRSPAASLPAAPRDRLAGLVAGRRAGDETAQPVPQVIVADPKGRTSASFRRFVVSVPVLSRQNVSTLLSDSMALVCCTGAPGRPPALLRARRRPRSPAGAPAAPGRQPPPLDQLDERVAPGDGANGQHHHQERRHQERQPDHTVDLALQRRQDATLGAGTGGDLVGEAVPADLLRLEAGAAGDAKLPEKTSSPARLRTRSARRSAATRPPPSFRRPPRSHRRRSGLRTDDQQVAAHDLARIDALLATVADYLRRRAGRRAIRSSLRLARTSWKTLTPAFEHHHQREDRVQGRPRSTSSRHST